MTTPPASPGASPCAAHLVDADAFILARRLGLIALLTRSPASTGALLMTGIIARNELNDIAAELSALEAAGILRVEELMHGTPAAQRAKELRTKKPSGRAVHKGEAEALAWLLETHPAPPRPVFISCDTGAREAAIAHGVLAGDVLDLAIAWLDRGIASLRELEEAFMPWETGPKGQLWRPSDFTTVKETIAKRRCSPLHPASREPR